MRVDFYGITDIGLKRPNNEDTLMMDPSLGYWAVADGMGGAAAGEVASRIFIETALDVFSTKASGVKSAELVQEVFRAANARIAAETERNPEYEGMGCTAELITFEDGEYVLGHVGDSRTYVCRNGNLRQITRDHSFIQDQLDRGLISRDEARTHSFKNVILRAVGVAGSLPVDLVRGKVLEGDIFLLCSDGLTDMVDDETIRSACTLPGDLQQKAERLIELAKSAGGRDNITVVLCRTLFS